MGFLSKLVPASWRRKTPQDTLTSTTGFKTFTETAPTFSAWDGSLYEMAQTRAIVERIAVACSKLKPEFVMPEGGTGVNPRVQKLFETWPNDEMTWPDFLRRLATILFTDTTAYVVPQLDRDYRVIGLYPLKPASADVIEYEDEPYIMFHMMNGDIQVFGFYQVGILTRFQLYSDIFGGKNIPLTSTLRLMDAQRQAEELALKNGARIRFIGKLVGLVQPDQMDKKREKFGEANLGPTNTSGMMVYDNTWESIQQIKEQSYTIDESEMDRIDKALYTYFGINEHILTNDYTEEQWGAFYEGCIEPFALMLGEQLTKMLISPIQRRHGNRIMFSSSYLEYATPESKRKVINDMLDRGAITWNQAADILQIPHFPGGDMRILRGEFYILDENNNVVAESGGHNSTTDASDEQDPDSSPPDEDEPTQDDDTDGGDDNAVPAE